jgi:methionine-rich copper-binding protein CopC
MIGRRFTFIGLVIPAVFAGAPVRAQKVVETMPTKDGTLSGVRGEYFIRFDQPVDHIHSTIDIMQDGKKVQTLRPRLNSEPTVLFARAPNLAPGKYVMHWSVPAANGSTVYQGEISFSVASGL